MPSGEGRPICIYDISIVFCLFNEEKCDCTSGFEPLWKKVGQTSSLWRSLDIRRVYNFSLHFF